MNRPPDKNPLLEKALSHKTNPGPVTKDFPVEEMDLIIKWFFGEVKTAQVGHALGIKNARVFDYAARCLRQWISEKRKVTINWKTPG